MPPPSGQFPFLHYSWVNSSLAVELKCESQTYSYFEMRIAVIKTVLFILGIICAIFTYAIMRSSQDVWERIHTGMVVSIGQSV